MRFWIVSDIIGRFLNIMGLMLLMRGFAAALYHETASGVAFCTGKVDLASGIVAFDWSSVSEGRQDDRLHCDVHGWAGADPHIHNIYPRTMEEMICVS